MGSTSSRGGSSLLAASLAILTACGSSEGPVLSGAGPGADDAGTGFEPGSDAGGGAAFDEGSVVVDNLVPVASCP
jgi:hypothetical protein